MGNDNKLEVDTSEKHAMHDDALVSPIPTAGPLTQKMLPCSKSPPFTRAPAHCVLLSSAVAIKGRPGHLTEGPQAALGVGHLMAMGYTAREAMGMLITQGSLQAMFCILEPGRRLPVVVHGNLAWIAEPGAEEIAQPNTEEDGTGDDAPVDDEEHGLEDQDEEEEEEDEDEDEADHDADPECDASSQD